MIAQIPQHFHHEWYKNFHDQTTEQYRLLSVKNNRNQSANPRLQSLNNNKKDKKKRITIKKETKKKKKKIPKSNQIEWEKKTKKRRKIVQNDPQWIEEDKKKQTQKKQEEKKLTNIRLTFFFGHLLNFNLGFKTNKTKTKMVKKEQRIKILS